MKRRVTKKTEQALLASSNQALFELLNLHNHEINDLEEKIAVLESRLEESQKESHLLRVSMHETHRSKSFRAGYFLLHPVGVARNRAVAIARMAKLRRKS